MWRLRKRCCWTTYQWKSLPTFKLLMETVWRIHILNGNDSQSQWLVGFLVWCVDASRNVVCQRMRHKKVVFPQIPRVDKHECIMWSHTIESRTSNTFIEMNSTSIPPRWTIRKYFWDISNEVTNCKNNGCYDDKWKKYDIPPWENVAEVPRTMFCWSCCKNHWFLFSQIFTNSNGLSFHFSIESR